ncbi:hypothetical protein F5Y14DRAFT_226267 [Nemania sp. NC0429]|nr:hypothetical protein F5Y14DRAFT_226267 [Nemania sp. NC0429]
MNPVPHLRIINPENTGSGSFPRFPSLPVELRLDIWELSLRRWRLINIVLAPKEEENADKGPRPEAHDTQGSVVRGAQYQVTARGPQLLSKLLRVSREARQAALHVYRVHLPCRLVVGDKEESSGILPLNPEFDIFRINLGYGRHDFVHFLRDIQYHDRKGVGLLNLAMDIDDINRLGRIDIPDLELDAQAAFTQTLRNLRQVFFVGIENTWKAYLGRSLSEIRTNDQSEFHRSRPIMSLIPSFDRLARDPRHNIHRDLSRVYAGTCDPRQMVCMWQTFLRRWNIIHPPGEAPVYRLMVSEGWETGGGDIVDRESAAEWLQKEDEIDEIRHSQQLRLAGRVTGAGYDLPLESPEELEEAPRPAIGFWLFPIEAIGPVPGPEALEDRNGFYWTHNSLVDMRQHWPELCLSRLT